MTIADAGVVVYTFLHRDALQKLIMLAWFCCSAPLMCLALRYHMLLIVSAVCRAGCRNRR